MPVFSVTRERALELIASVEEFLAQGYPAPGTTPSGCRDKTALRMAAEKHALSPMTLRGQVGTPLQHGSVYKKYGLQVNWSKYAPASQEPPSPIPQPQILDSDRKYVLLQDENRELRKQIKELYRAFSTDEIIRELVGNFVDTPRDPPSWINAPPERDRGQSTPEVPVTIWSDWHVGETIERAEVNGFNEFSIAIAEERVERLVDVTLRLCRENHTGIYPGVVVNLLGDFVSGGIHPELKATDEEEVIPSSLKAADWLVAGLTRLADEFGRVYVPACTGNHGRHTIKPEFKRYYRKNFDWLIVQVVARHFADDKRIQFDIRPSNDVHYRVFGERYLACHGDMLGVRGGDGIIGSIGPIVRGEIKQSGQSSGFGMGFDKILMGHWHQRLWLPRAIVNNALKGFDEYAMKMLGAKPDRPTQALWFVHPSHGITAHWDIYVDKKPEPATEWVAWKEAV